MVVMNEPKAIEVLFHDIDHVETASKVCRAFGISQFWLGSPARSPLRLAGTWPAHTCSAEKVRYVSLEE
jgi:hypothetical protein